MKGKRGGERKGKGGEMKGKGKRGGEGEEGR